MMWIELIGPHGIGKTTLRRRLRSYYVERPQLSRKDVVPLVQAWDFSHPTKWDELACWGPFLSVVERLYRKSTNDARPDYKRRRNMCVSLMRMHILRSIESSGTEAWDLIGSEGMRLSFMLRNPDKIRAYFETMPVSAGVVVLEADPGVIVARNKARAPVTDLGVWAEQGVRACAIAADVLARRTRVLRLDATHPVDENARAIAEFAGLQQEG